MAKTKEIKEEKKGLAKGKSQFEVVGTVGKIGEWTFKIDTKSDSGYLYSSAQLNINTGNNNVVRVEAMGGCYPNSTGNTIRVRSKENNERFEIEWEDRKNEAVLENVSDFDFITVALEKDTKGNLFYKKFLTWYDAVDYVKDNIQEGMVVKVKGNLNWSEYNDIIKARKNIQSIYLATATPEEYHATFTQTVLLESDAVDKSHAKEDKIVDINAKVVDYDKLIKKQRPFDFTYKVKLEDGKEKACLAVVSKFLTVGDKKVLRELAVDGNIVEGAEVGSVSVDDISDELRELIECGIYTEEEILGKMAVKGDKVVNFYITKPHVQKDKEGVTKVFMDDKKYTLEDLFVEAGSETVESAPKATAKTEKKEATAVENSDEPPFDTDDAAGEGDSTEDELDWMKELD